MLESALEKYATMKVRKCGGFAPKWLSPGLTGVPDRIFLFPGGRIVFVEFKRPGRIDGMSPRQKKVAGILTRLGFTVKRIGTKEEVNMLLEEFGYAV